MEFGPQLWQGRCNGTARLSVPPSLTSTDRCSGVRRVCCCGPQQHGVQQQMRAVSRCQLTQEAEQKLAFLFFLLPLLLCTECDRLDRLTFRFLRACK